MLVIVLVTSACAYGMVWHVCHELKLTNETISPRDIYLATCMLI